MSRHLFRRFVVNEMTSIGDSDDFNWPGDVLSTEAVVALWNKSVFSAIHNEHWSFDLRNASEAGPSGR